MIVLSSIYVIPILLNCVFVSSTVLSPLQTDGSIRIFKDIPNEYEYVLKRHSPDVQSEDPDSKERRSSKGSSFIRFGRSETAGNMENSAVGFDADVGFQANRYPRGKSSDVVIRFGRSGSKGTDVEQAYKRGRNDLNFIRFGRDMEPIPTDFNRPKDCIALLTNETLRSKEMQPIMKKLYRICMAYFHPLQLDIV